MRGKWLAGLTVFLAVVALIVSRAEDFSVFLRIEDAQDAAVDYPAQTDSYYRSLSAASPTGAWTIIDMQLGQTAVQTFLDAGIVGSADRQLYRLQEIALTDTGDADEDGMDDVWELRHPPLDGLNPTDASQDFDEDGYSNFEEYQVGADPNRSNAAPVIAITYPRDGSVIP
ncbi:MAG: hypothetical protein KJ626_11575 [Verrucomicrobia bacterium]|nr:hypothetical protein [Verrucomicrobiota bacterium]